MQRTVMAAASGRYINTGPPLAASLVGCLEVSGMAC
jgi:hypothetical protein